jgi:hypothetical protein
LLLLAEQARGGPRTQHLLTELYEQLLADSADSSLDGVSSSSFAGGARTTRSSVSACERRELRLGLGERARDEAKDAEPTQLCGRDT